MIKGVVHVQLAFSMNAMLMNICTYTTKAKMNLVKTVQFCRKLYYPQEKKRRPFPHLIS